VTDSKGSKDLYMFPGPRGTVTSSLQDRRGFYTGMKNRKDLTIRNTEWSGTKTTKNITTKLEKRGPAKSPRGGKKIRGGEVALRLKERWKRSRREQV